MGKSSGGVTDWHKKQHKKQLAKNKEARIAARDERVIQEKTVEDVRAEIRKLEQQYKNEELRPHPIQSKLDRLKKELKLVTAKEEADKQNRERTLQQQKAIAKPDVYVPLERPEVSVYFDATMNPFGAPPPGKPKLYYRRGGGTTMNLNEACTPQEQFLPPPPPPPPPRAAPQMSSPAPPRPPPTRGPPTQKFHTSRSILQNDGKKPNVESESKDALSTTNVSKSVKVPVNPSQLPSLPAPSAAVARMKQNRLAMDIWASQEEIEYEEQVSATSLEGVGTPVAVPTVWFYRDMAGAVQGPFTTDQMCQWNQAGYFPHTTPVSGTSNSGPWSPLSDIKVLNDSSGSKKDSSDANNTTKSKSSVQDRIAALRQSQLPSQQSVGVSPEPVSEREGDEMGHSKIDLNVRVADSVPSRIAALKADYLSNDVGSDDGQDQDPSTGQGPLHVNLTSAEQEKVSHSNTPEEIDDVDGENSPKVMTVQDRIAALRAQRLNTVTEDGVGERNFRQNDHERYNNLPLPPPPPPPPKASKALDDIPIYPVDDNVASYPIDDEENMEISDTNIYDDQYVSYSVDEKEYPVTGDYGDDSVEFPIDSSDSYPVTDSYVEESKELVEPAKKKVKVDQAVRALVPARLLKR